MNNGDYYPIGTWVKINKEQYPWGMDDNVYKVRDGSEVGDPFRTYIRPPSHPSGVWFSYKPDVIPCFPPENEWWE